MIPFFLTVIPFFESYTYKRKGQADDGPRVKRSGAGFFKCDTGFFNCDTSFLRVIPVF